MFNQLVKVSCLMFMVLAGYGCAANRMSSPQNTMVSELDSAETDEIKGLIAQYANALSRKDLAAIDGLYADKLSEKAYQSLERYFDDVERLTVHISDVHVGVQSDGVVCASFVRTDDIVDAATLTISAMMIVERRSGAWKIVRLKKPS
ncbi:MAG: nuclear transport factor 2 family protein [Patescibacteria group bacterium]